MRAALETLNCKVLQEIRSDIYKVSYSGATYNVIKKFDRRDPFTPPIIKVLGDYVLISDRVKPLVDDDAKPYFPIEDRLFNAITEKVKLLHKTGFLHGNLVAQNIFLEGATKVYFVGFKAYNTNTVSWQQELNLRDRSTSIQALSNSDYELWINQLDLEDVPLDIVEDHYEKRFILEEYRLQDNKAFAYVMRKKFNYLCKTYVIKGRYEYYISSFMGRYFDMTGVYKGELSVKTMYNSLIDEIHGTEKHVEPVIREVALTKGTEMSELEGAIKVASAWINTEKGDDYTRADIDSASYLNLDGLLEPIYKRLRTVKSRLDASYHEEYLRLNEVEDPNYLIALKLMDIREILGTRPLAASFVFPLHTNDLLVTLYSIDRKSKLEAGAAPLVAYSLKHQVDWLAQVLLHLVNIEGNLQNFGWFYKILAADINQALTLLDKLSVEWNIHYTYMIILIRTYATIVATPEDKAFLETIVTICLSKSYYDILLFFKDMTEITKILTKLDPGLLKIRTLPQEETNDYRLVSSSAKIKDKVVPLVRYTVLGSTQRQHYLHYNKTEITEELCLGIIKNNLVDCDILAIISDAPQLWAEKQAKFAWALTENIQSYDVSVRTRVAISCFNFLTPQQLNTFLLRINSEDPYKVGDYIRSKRLRL